MTTIVNNPPAVNNSDSTLGTLVGIVILIILGYLFWAYGIPALKNSNFGRPQVNVPSQIDINVNQAK